jgi:hypothetical protein
LIHMMFDYIEFYPKVIKDISDTRILFPLSWKERGLGGEFKKSFPPARPIL